jgi:long-chain acyl-CoA synthetase
MTEEYKTIVELAKEQVEKFGDRIWYYYKKQNRWVGVSFREAHDETRAVAAGLLALGVEKGECVGIVSETRREWALADMAILSCGAVTVGVYPTETPQNTEYILNHSGSRFVFVENRKQYEKIKSIIQKLPNIKKLILFENEDIQDELVVSLEEIRKSGEEFYRLKPEEYENRYRSITLDDIATIVYTSGTTGPPKGVVLTHRNISAVTVASAKAIPLREDDFGIVFLPLSHVLQRVSGYVGLYLGARGAFAESIEKIVDNFQELKPTVQSSVPRLFEKFYIKVLSMVENAPERRKKIFHWCMNAGHQVSALKRAKKKIPLTLRIKYKLADLLVFRKIKKVLGGRIRFMVSGAAPISVKILEFFHAAGILILEGYGLTETAAPATVNRLDDYKFGTVGKPIPCCEVKIAEDGEVLIRGENVFKEYYKNPEATKEAFTSDGWFKTGDIGTIDEDGFLKITDRKKELIITAGGKNIAPQNIENVLKSSQYISHAFVYGDRRKYLTALITLDSEEVENYLRAKNVPHNSSRPLSEHPEVMRLIEREVLESNRHLARFEQIKKFRILKDDFSVETGELTPTMKLKRRVITEKYKKLLDEMYENEDLQVQE